MSDLSLSRGKGDTAIATYIRLQYPGLVAEAEAAYHAGRVARTEFMRARKRDAAVARIMADAEKLNERLVKLGVPPLVALTSGEVGIGNRTEVTEFVPEAREYSHR